MFKLEDLSAPFERDVISWRAQSVTKDGTKAMALAYIDARDVMKRLDSVCGPMNWQDRYPHAGQKTIAEIGIRLDGEWIWKSDGAGDTDVEAEKGAISDAFKRAAVKWGIGRYLYDMPAPWVPCESYKVGDKYRWSKFTQTPWDFVGPGIATPKTHIESVRRWEDIRDELANCDTAATLEAIWRGNYKMAKTSFSPEIFKILEDTKEEMKQVLMLSAGMSPGFNQVGAR